jgi:undecaprenyl diphosphate synthase
MQLFREYLKKEVAECAKHGIRINVIGRRDRLDPALCRAIERAEVATLAGDNLNLRIAVDYSARDSILAAADLLSKQGSCSRESFAASLGEVINDRGPVCDVDLLIRTGGEKRLSDFLLWECAYAELVFIDKMWPDFAEADLAAAVAEFDSRQRRFGGLLRVAR